MQPISSICSECATKLGLVPVSYPVPMYMALCQECNQTKLCTNGETDWLPRLPRLI